MDPDRCGRPAAYRYTWPGNDEAFICEAHSHQLQAVANALGFHLQLIPILSDILFHPTCSQVLESSGENGNDA